MRGHHFARAPFEEKAMSHVIVVEDEPITAADLEHRLDAMGHEVTWFDTGEEAVARAPSLAPDLVLMDIRLRGELNGIDAARMLRDQSDTPIVFLTAFSDQATVDRVCETHAYGYLLKPFTERSVETAVQVVLSRAHADRDQLDRERWIGQAMQDAGDAVIAVDEAAAVRFINARAETLFAIRAQDVMGTDAHELLQFADDRDDGAQPLD